MYTTTRNYCWKSKIRKIKKPGTGITTLNSNKPLTKLLVLLAQVKAGDNSNKLKSKIRQKLYLVYQHNKISKTFYNNLVKSF